MLQSLDSFCDRLSATALSQAIQTIDWIIPAVQTVHILAVGVVVSSVLMVDLRLLGLHSRQQSIAAVTARFLPFVWYSLPILLATGATLIIAEPSRALQNPVFMLKMALLLVATAVTLACQIPVRQDERFWDRSASRRRLAALVACLSLPLWTGIVFAGRWIAYVQSK
ncbi:MAG TPA: DUF6644 family protein [Steroidobacteraceae bacterium]|nr:DUF6644 family protein [Steroidobacteraceae bacterium]